MSRNLFMCIHDGIISYDDYFIQKRNAAKIEGLSSLQKITAALRMLTYGVSGDMLDEYLRIAESTSIEAFKKFVEAVISIFCEQYLRNLTSSDIK